MPTGDTLERDPAKCPAHVCSICVEHGAVATPEIKCVNILCLASYHVECINALDKTNTRGRAGFHLFNHVCPKCKQTITWIIQKNGDTPLQPDEVTNLRNYQVKLKSMTENSRKNLDIYDSLSYYVDTPAATPSLNTNNMDMAALLQQIGNLTSLITTIQKDNKSNMDRLEKQLEAKQQAFNSTSYNIDCLGLNNNTRPPRPSFDSAPLPDNSVNANNESLLAIANLTVRAQHKEEHKTLPQVTEQGYQWLIFYRAFLDTKNFFSAAENVDRINKALVEPTIKDHGAGSIIAETYEQTLAQMHEIFYNPDVIIINSMEKLQKARPKSKVTTVFYQELLLYISRMRHHLTMVQNLGIELELPITNMIAQLVDTLPIALQTAWFKKSTKIRSEHRVATIEDLQQFLATKIPELQEYLGSKRHLNSAFLPAAVPLQWNMTEERPPENLNVSQSSGPKHDWEFKCWVDRSDDHLISQCPTALNMTGSEVFELALKKGICSRCGREHFKHNVPCTSKFAPPNCRNCPDKRHWGTICPKRAKGEIVYNDLRGRRGARGRGRGFSNAGNGRVYNTINSENQADATEHSQNNASSSSTNWNNNVNQSTTTAPVSQPNLMFLTSQDMNEDYEFNNVHMINELPVQIKNPINNMTFSSKRTSTKYMSAIPLKMGTEKLIAAGILDSAATVSLIDEDLAKSLHARGPWYGMNLVWSGGQSRHDPNSCLVKIEVETFDREPESVTMYFHTFKDLQIGSQPFSAADTKQKHKHLRKLNLQDYEKLSFVVGVDQAHLFAPIKSYLPETITSEYVVGIACKLGHYVLGTKRLIGNLYDEIMKKAEKENLFLHQQQISTNAYMNLIVDNEYAELMERHIMGSKYRNFPDPHDRDLAEDVAAIEYLKHHVKKTASGHYEAPILWKNPDVVLPTELSKHSCYAKQKRIMHRLNKEKQYELAQAEVDKLILKNYAEKIPNIEVPTSKSFYNSIFFISPPGKRFRMIWNAASKLKDGTTLNDYISPGPNLYNDLSTMLHQMREHRFFVKGDIKEMFHQIKILPQDQEALKFIFIDRDNKIINTFKMLRMVFGVACSPFTSQYIIRLCADEHTTEFKSDCDIIRSHIYVDDLVKAYATEEEATTSVLNIKSILRSGKFELVKLNSNSKLINNNLKLTCTSNDEENYLSQENVEKLLGYKVDFEADTIGLEIDEEKWKKVYENVKHPTKTEVLSATMSPFDPLNIFAFATSKFKLLYHEVCKLNIDWKNKIASSLVPQWDFCVKNLNNVKSLMTSRCYNRFVEPNEIRQLFLFTDAGSESGCAVAYCRTLTHNREQKSVTIMGAKHFVTPLKEKRTIPELEFNAISIGISYIQDLIKSHTIKFDEFYLLTDSAVCFEWVNNEIAKPSVYLKNRMTKIINCLIRPKIFWINADLQAADYATKMSSVPKYSQDNEWFKPKLFGVPESLWPALVPPQYSENFTKARDTLMTNYISNFLYIHKKQEINYEMSETFYHILQEASNYDGNFFDVNRYSTLNNAIDAVTRYLMKIRHYKHIKKISEANRLIKEAITQDSRDQSEFIHNNELIVESELFKSNLITYNAHLRDNILKLFIIDAQQEIFHQEISLIQEGKSLSPKHHLFKFTPVIKEGVLRATSRLYETDDQNKLTSTILCPIILPKGHHLTELIILNHHANHYHCMLDTTVAEIKLKYYIKNINTVIKKVIKQHCFHCRKFNAKRRQPIMGSLPIERLCHEHQAFVNINVDMAGPFVVYENEILQKRWLLFVVCLSTRALHIEIMHTANANSFILALLNCFHIRGKASKIFCDRGTNFTGGEKEILAEINRINKQRQETTPIQLNFVFSPAGAPHYNGSVERIIGLSKSVMERMRLTMLSSNLPPNDESFRNIWMGVMDFLNNRPICPNPIEGSLTHLLTPNFFIMLRPNSNITPLSGEIAPSDEQSWRMIQKLLSILWNHWLKFYIPNIMYREKWVKLCENININDIVMVPALNKVGEWQLGRVINTSGSNDQNRELTIQLGKKTHGNKQNKIPSRMQTRSMMKNLYNKDPQSIVTRYAGDVCVLNLDPTLKLEHE